jgi:hypothetical protein
MWRGATWYFATSANRDDIPGYIRKANANWPAVLTR